MFQFYRQPASINILKSVKDTIAYTSAEPKRMSRKNLTVFHKHNEHVHGQQGNWPHRCPKVTSEEKAYDYNCLLFLETWAWDTNGVNFLVPWLLKWLCTHKRGPSSSCGMIILRNKPHGENIKEIGPYGCTGIFRTAPRKENTVKFSIKIPHVTSKMHRLLSDRLLFWNEAI